MSGDGLTHTQVQKAVIETVDAFHYGRFHVVQPKGIGHRSGMDAMLLAALVAGQGPIRVADLGAGAGAAGLAVAARIEKAEVLLVERSPLMADFARKTLALPSNAAFAGRVSVLEADVSLSGRARVAAGLVDEACDYVIMNPPFNDRIYNRPPDALKAEAHAMDEDLFERWIRTAAAILKPGGQLSLIARPQSIGEIIAACGRRLGGIEITALHPRADEAALRILVTAIKGKRTSLSLRMPLVMHEPGQHAFTPFVKDLNNGNTAYARLSKA
ncbi:tRNA1(Val) (adenine(37)-N6)-methyltransferase [Shinella sp.]|uniref:tRNA1(Val) (adenine(37)-N6)-methyltransferase n=1 Tax=Shinella sp. TaxID=1870904 RepID=UPI003C70D542